MGKLYMHSVFYFFLSLFLISCSVPDVRLGSLCLEMKENPVGINVMEPRFSWRIISEKKDLRQLSYQIQVGRSISALKKGKDLVWDSGAVDSDQSVLLPYKGKTLESEGVYYWRVKVSTNKGESGWSGIQRWTMSILDNASWTARWIGIDGTENPGENLGGPGKSSKTRLAARYLRKEFAVDRKVDRAMLYISGLGSSECYINGQRVSEDIFAPMPSWYPVRVYYNVYDVTALVRKNENTIGVILGNGRYMAMRRPGMKTFGLPSLLAELHIFYKDGSSAAVVSDETWKATSKGPIVANNEFDGEEYDARLEKEMVGWNRNGFDDSRWKDADKMPVPSGTLTAQQNPNIRIQDTVVPVSVTARPDGKYIVDMGQNMVGWLKVALKGRKGQPVTMRFAEFLKEDGSLNTENLGNAKQTDVYIPSENGPFVWEPRFVYHGFRYVEISGIESPDPSSKYEGMVIYDKMKTTGSIFTSDSLVNRIYRNAYWGIRGNYRGMPTDCPQRSERMGWLGDRATGAYGEAYMFNNALLYRKWLDDIEDSAGPEGQISSISPCYWRGYQDDVTWPSAFFYAADMLYRQYGDEQAIKDHYPAMKRWIEYMTSNVMKDHILPKDRYGDWCVPTESPELVYTQDSGRMTPPAVLSTTVFYDLLHTMSDFAKISGRGADSKNYLELAARIKEAYNKAFFDEKNCTYGNSSVTGNLLSLHLGLVPEAYAGKLAGNIVRKITEEFDSHVCTGVVGIQHLMRTLTENGYLDLAYRILTNDTYPSWGYMVRKDATTIWELWNGVMGYKVMNSGNHVMLLGDLLLWSYESLGGIKNAEGSVGFKKLFMKPVFPEGLDHIEVSHESPYGWIRSAWTRKDGRFEWRITIPENSSAEIVIPRSFGVEVEQAEGIRRISHNKENLTIEAGSGSYIFKNR